MDKKEIIERIRQAREIIKPIDDGKKNILYLSYIREALDKLKEASNSLLRRNVHLKERRNNTT